MKPHDRRGDLAGVRAEVLESAQDSGVVRHRKAHDQLRPMVTYGHDVPNFPEVSGTSFPVLATVLAGFAVTISMQLILRTDSSAVLQGRVMVALGALLLSTLALLVSTVFAINAQARNDLPFLDLSEAGRRLLYVNDLDAWIWGIWGIERQWYVFHWASVYAFYSGVALLLAGLNLLVWVYVGMTLAVIFLSAIVVSLGITCAVAVFAERACITKGQQP